MERTHILMLAAGLSLGGGAAAQAGPCTAQIAELEQRIRSAQANPPPGGAGALSAPQSIGAQLHHQPTRSSLESAEVKARAGAEAALGAARNADARGDAQACANALDEAKAIYGLE